jgi:hypothetical protein
MCSPRARRSVRRQTLRRSHPRQMVAVPLESPWIGIGRRTHDREGVQILLNWVRRLIVSHSVVWAQAVASLSPTAVGRLAPSSRRAMLADGRVPRVPPIASWPATPDPGQRPLRSPWRSDQEARRQTSARAVPPTLGLHVGAVYAPPDALACQDWNISTSARLQSGLTRGGAHGTRSEIRDVRRNRCP